MNFNPKGFLTNVKELITGGGRTPSGQPYHDAGYLKKMEGITLKSLSPTAAVTATAGALTVTDGAGTNDGTIPAISTGGAAADQDDTIAAVQELAAAINALIADNAAIRSHIGLVADETNARVIKVEEGVDSVGNFVVHIPRDYDEATDHLRLRVLASMVSVSTDTDVELDLEAYRKRPGAALSADLDPTKPGTILSATEQWIEFDLGQNSLQRDDMLILELITNGANDSNGEEVLIHGVEVEYRSTLVSYRKATAAGVPLR